MRKLSPAVLLIALAAALLCHQPTPAQEAPEQPEAKQEAEPVLLTTDEIKLWQAWIRGDLKGCYARAQSMLDHRNFEGSQFHVALALQSRCADGLGWYEAHQQDLEALLDTHAGTESEDAVRWELIKCLKHNGRIGAVASHVAALGFINDWWICGPFSNDRGQGFEDVQEPQRDLSLDAEYTGKEGQLLKFRALPAEPLDGTVDFGAMLRPNNEASAFLLTAIWCEQGDPNATFHMGSSGEQWMQRILGVDESGNLKSDIILADGAEREAGFDQSSSSAIWDKRLPKRGLQPGWNVLLVKSGHSGGEWLSRIRVSTEANWRCGDEAELRAALENASGEPLGPPAVGFSTLSNRALLIRAVRELLSPALDRTSTRSRRDIDEAMKEFENSPGSAAELSVVQYLAAWANKSASRVLAGKEENRRRELLKQCLDLDPLAARAALELSQYYTTTFGNPASADEYAQTAVKANPTWTEARVYASRVVLMKGLDMEVERELAKLLQEYPEDANVLRFSAYYAGQRRDYKLSNELFGKALKADFADSYSRERLIERAVARADLPTALKLATEARKLDPFDTAAARNLSELFLYSDKFSLAERELNNALKIAPRDDALLEKLAHVYSAWADASQGEEAADLRVKAQETFEAALEANPKREDIERYLEFLEGEQPPFEAALQEDITERIEAALEMPVDGDNAYEVIYSDEIVVVNEDGTTSQYIQTAYRITNDNGREWLQRLEVPAYSDQQGRCVAARLWRADGDIEEGRRSKYGASFSPLEIGDVVQVRFRVTDREQSFFGDFYGTRKPMADYVPVHEVRYSWVLPQGRTFHEYLANGAPARVEQTIQGKRVWSYRATNLHKVYDEPLAPPLEQRSPTVQISTYANWNEFGRWYYNLIRKQMEPTPEMTAKVAEITNGLKTERDKARAVYNWVVTEVRYNADWHFGVHGYKPFSAGAVFARCIGDCKDKALLICTMLRIAGVTAYPVITNLENFRGDEDITLPMPNHFNHAIAHIEYSDGSSQFVDGTATYNGIDELGSGDRGANCIIVRPDGGERVQIPWGSADEDSQTDDIDAEFAQGGTLKLTVTRTAVGDSASLLRSRYEREGDRKKQLEREWSEFYPGAKVSAIVVNDLSDLDVQPKISFSVELPNAYATQGNRIELRAALDPREWTQTSFGSLTSRKTDLLTPAPYERRSVVRYKLPAGYTVAKLPAALSIEHENVNLSWGVESKDGVLTVTRAFAMLGGTVKASDYPEFRRKLIEFDTAEQATIKLTK